MRYHKKPAICEECPAFKVGVSYVPFRGPANAKLAIIGQGPGGVEAIQGKPFFGPSGKMLNSWLLRADIAPHHVYFDNIVRCQLPADRPPKVAESTYCLTHLVLPDLSKLEHLTTLVPCGVPSQKALLGTGGERQLGSIHTVTIEGIHARIGKPREKSEGSGGSGEGRPDQPNSPPEADPEGGGPGGQPDRPVGIHRQELPVS